MMIDEIIIDQKLLTKMGACQEGKTVYKELFPNGATLSNAIAGLDAAGHGFGTIKHDDWSEWLFNHFRSEYKDHILVASGYRNTGNCNTGNCNTGNRNTGDCNTGDWNTGNRNTGYWNTGDCNTGNCNTGYRNTGYRNTGYCNTGYWNTGNCNTGDWNTGDRNTGYWNTGNCNTGYRNTGNRNTGNRNTGNCNTGDWNTGDRNTGFFNIDTPKTVKAFGKEIDREIWDNAVKPSFLYFDLTYWVDESRMTDADKIADPNFHVRGGQLRKKDYKKAFKESWDKADKVDREKVRDLPGFDAEMFYEISGIDLR